MNPLSNSTKSKREKTKQMVEWRRLQGRSAEPNDSLGLELSGPWITLGGSDSHRRGEGEEVDPSLLDGDESKPEQS